MAGEIEAAGELATGALLGRAVEPHAGEGHGGGHGLCLNCGTALIGAHCHACGQAGHVHRSLSAMGHDILHGVFHFEGKLWRTLPMLAWRPGDLTRRYIEGERARFVSPMAIFLFSLFAMFAVFSWVGISAPTDLQSGNAIGKVIDARKALAEQRDRAIERRDRHAVGDPRRTAAEEQIADLDHTLALMPTAEAIKDGKHNDVHVSSTLSGWAPIDHGIEKWNKNPSLMLYKLQSSVYKFSWLLIPLSLPFMWLLFFWKRHYKLYDHTVFVTYSIAFMSLFFIAVTLVGALGLGHGWLPFAALAIPFAHIVRQLKQAYRLRWTTAVLRAVILSIFIVFIVSIFLMLLVAMGLFG
jgi:hypothetical protein